ncbi:MAG TPA: PaaI family thioesterase [Burkholderiales bacterium]|nr:PaaI family thioesterase [Burkholderiales bacterium]
MDKDAFFWKVMSGALPPPRVAATLGIKFRSVDSEKGEVEVEFEGRPEFTNPVGNIQGGILAAMLDDTMGPALASRLAAGEFAPTLNLNVSFEKPARVGVILGRGRVVKQGRDVCFLSGELFQEGERVAAATATALIRRLPAGGA